jgi:hypothetical protein
MPYVGFEPTIPAFERAKTIHALDGACTVIGERYINYDELEGIRKEEVVAQYWYYPGICLMGLKICCDSMCPYRDSNRRPPPCKSRELPPDQPARLSASCCKRGCLAHCLPAMHLRGPIYVYKANQRR